jgi:hypothetical protein
MIQKRFFIAFLVLMSFATLGVASSAIDAKYKEIGATTLGKPSGPEKSAAGGGRVRLYANGGIWSTKATGTHAVYGATYDKYKSLGAESGRLGYPVTDVRGLPDGSEQTLFRHGYIVINAGVVNAQVMDKATFTPDSVTVKGMKATKTTQNEAFVQVLPETGATFSCDCLTQRGDTGTGSCDLRITGEIVRCASVNCKNNCRLTFVRGAQ